MIKAILEQEELKMKKAIDHLRKEFLSVRSGKASVSLIENIRVDYYGNNVPLSQVASIHAPDPRTLTVNPWEKNLIQIIEKAILQSSLGLNPSNDGVLIRIPVPSPTEERRRDYVKIAHKMAEDCKVAIRNVRRDGINKLKQDEKAKTISEDDSKKAQKKLQDYTDEFIKEIDELTLKKEKEIMEV
ncbi:MAG: ribosome recycling factor [Candidatus Delongbacteria bacterium]|nr:ribosome recycling factor [Candidatus Delongbacteria bacterium]